MWCIINVFSEKVKSDFDRRRDEVIMPLKFPKEKWDIEEKVANKEEKQLLKKINQEAMYKEIEPKYSFDDIILTRRQIDEINIAVSYDKNKELIMNQWGLSKVFPEKKGLMINLYGASGTGKTMVAHAISKKLEKKMIIVNYAEIESKYVGETSKNLIKVFEEAGKSDDVLLFDEADALLSKRVTKMSSSTDISVNQTKSVLLNIMNDYSGIVIFTTNFIANYDYAFMRRIPFQIKFDLPNEEQRIGLWNYYLSTGIPYSFDVGVISKLYDGLSGSDIANAVWMTALSIAEKKKNKICDDDIRETIQNILNSKKENEGNDNAKIVSVREVDEEYALKQIGVNNS